MTRGGRKGGKTGGNEKTTSHTKGRSENSAAEECNCKAHRLTGTLRSYQMCAPLTISLSPATLAAATLEPCRNAILLLSVERGAHI